MNQHYHLVSDVPTGNERFMYVTLQGIANREAPRLYLVGEQETDGHWVDWYKNYGLKPEDCSIDDALEDFLPETNGAYILGQQDEDWEVPLAITMAGLNDRIVITPRQKERIEGHGTSVDPLPVPQFGSRLEAMAWASNHLRPNTNPEVLHSNAWHHEKFSIDISDWIVAHRGFSFRLTTHPTRHPGERELLADIYDNTPLYSHVLGWHLSDGETSIIHFASQYGLLPFCMTRNLNFSFHQHIEAQEDFRQKPSTECPEFDDTQNYVTFVFSDGDAPHSMVDLQKRQWTHNKRGHFPFGWAVPPQMLTFGPAMLEYFYKTVTPQDELLCGPSGLGYNYLSGWAIRRTDISDPRASRAEYLQRTNDLMKQLDLHGMWPINRIIEWLPDGRMLSRIAGDDVWAINNDTAPSTYGIDFMDDALIRDYCTHVPTSRGFFQGWHNIPNEQERFFENTPYFPGKVMAASPPQTLQDIEQQTTLEDSPVFIPVHVNCYKMDLGEVEETINLLDEDRFTVLLPGQFCKMATQTLNT